MRETNEKKVFLSIGGDLRFIYAAEALAKTYKVYGCGYDDSERLPEGVILTYDLTEISGKADYVLLPLPVSRDEKTVNAPFSRRGIPLDMIPLVIKENGIVFGGMFSASAMEIFRSKGINTIDYFENEELNILNAVATAEGAVKVAIENTHIAVFGSNILVTGFGRIAKALIKILKGMGANVTVAARKNADLTWSGVYGCGRMSMPELSLEGFDIVFNTVPEVIITRNILESAGRRCLLIDLASKPGGVDFKAAEEMSVETIHALALPGKTAPKTAGEIIASVCARRADRSYP